MSGLFGGGQKISTTAPLVASMRLQTSVAGKPIPVVLGRTRVAGNLLQYADFIATPHTTVTNSGGGGGKGGGSGAQQEDTTYTYSAAVIIGICAGEIADVLQVWKGKGVASLANLGLSLYVGDASQTPYGYFATNHPSDADAYRRIAYVASGAYPLASDGSLENHNFEVQGDLAYGGGIDDADIADVIAYIATDDFQGLQLPGGAIGDATQFSKYCVANSIFVSPAYVDRETAQTIIERLARIGNGSVFWSEDTLKFTSYGDDAATGNGVTFTPDLTPLYDLTDSDYLDKDQPVQMSRPSPADAFNDVVVKYFNRDNGYNEDAAEGKDQGDVEVNGLKQDPSERVYHEIARSDTAQFVADQEVAASLYGERNGYVVTVGRTYDLVEQNDLLTLTDAYLGLDRQLVRVVQIDENDNEELRFTCVEVEVGTASPAAHASSSSSGYAADYNADPGDVNAPIMFVAPYTLSLGALQLWVGLSGGDQFGGAEVWVSEDDASYRRIGSFRGKSRMGVTTSPMQVQPDPDDTTTLGVNLSESAGVLLAGTQQDANHYNTLCYAGGELFSYRDAALTGTNQYDLTHLRRGAYGSPVSIVAAGAGIVRVDEGLFKYGFPPEFAGRTIYLKFLAFNTTGGGRQQLADVSPYTFILSQEYAGVPQPPGVFGLELFGQGTDTEFVGRDAKFDWRASGNQHSFDIGSEPFGAGSGGADPYFRDFEIQVSAGSQVLRVEHVTDTVYTYTYEKNAEDNGGAAVRTFTISVWQRNQFGRVSNVPAQLTVSNPQPALPGAVDIRAAFQTVFLGYTPPPETDWVGLVVWMSTSAGFTPSALNLVYQGSDSLVVIDADPGVQYYLRYASYDSFGADGVTASGEVTVTTSKIAPVDIGDAAVLTTHIADAAITTAKVALDAITNDLIAANAVTSTEIADNSITTPKLVAGSVVTAKLAAGAVTANEIAANTITTAKLTAGVITANEISAGAVTTAKIQAGAVTANEIAANTITTAKLTAGVITANEIATDAVIAAKIQAGAITTNKLDAGSVTTAKLAAGAVTANEIAAGTITAAKIATGTITAASAIIDTAAITTLTVAGNAITTPVSSYSNAGIGASGGVDTNLISVTITTTGQPVFLTGFFTAVYGGGGTASIALKIKRGSTTLATTTIQQLLAGAQGQGTGMGYTDQPAAGTYTYYLSANPNAGCTLYECSLFAVEVKR